KQEPIRENQETFPLAWRCALPYLAANADGGDPAAPETRGNPRTGSPDRLRASRRGSDGPALGPGHRIGAPAMVRNRIPGPRKRGSSSREAATGHFGGHPLGSSGLARRSSVDEEPREGWCFGTGFLGAFSLLDHPSGVRHQPATAG